VGTTRGEFAGSHLDAVNPYEGGDIGPAPAPDTGAPERYRRLHRAIRSGLVRSCHDLSEGGLDVAVAEMCIGGRLGATIDALPHADVPAALFGESIGRLLVEVAPSDIDTFVAQMAGDAIVLGHVSDTAHLSFDGIGTVPIDDLVAAFTGNDA